MLDEPKVILGDNYVDDRGIITFFNEFSPPEVKRIYMLENFNVGYVRAWHGHKFESKYFMVLDGTAMIGAVKIDNWENPSKELRVHKFILSKLKPKILFIPAGYANGIMSLEGNTKVLVFSNCTLEESKLDDFRFDARYWDIWEIKER